MKHLDNNEPKDNDDLDNKLERILSDLVMDIRVAENLGKTVDEMLVPSDKAKAAITKQIIQAEAEADTAARRSQTDHLFSVIRSLGYKIDQKAVMRLSKEWNRRAAEHQASLQNQLKAPQ